MGRTTAPALALGEWRRARLHCDAGPCAHWYRLDVGGAGELEIDVYATSGADAPDFDVRLEDDTRELLWGFAPTGESPRKVRRVVGPGVYHLLVWSIGERGGTLDYEIHPRLIASEPVVLPRSPVPGRTQRQPRAPRRPEIWLTAGIVRVEGRAGLPAFVVIDAGARDDLRPGMRGELVAEGRAIAAFELVDVEARESRARLAGPPAEAITFATTARVRVPLDSGSD